MNSIRPYRKGINAIIVDENNTFLIVQLISYKENEWKFVGGGVNEGESYEDALYREVEEEVGLKKDQYEVLGKSQYMQKYDFPETMKDNPIYAKFKGQEKAQYVIRIRDQKNIIQLQEEEIRAVKWVSFEELEANFIFPRQYSNALQIIEEFKLNK